MGTIYDHDEACVSYESRDVQMACLLDAGLTNFHHMHREIEIVYVLEGATEAYADNNRCVLHAGDLFINHTVHCIVAGAADTDHNNLCSRFCFICHNL